MAMFPGAKGDAILAWRGIAELIGEIREKSTERMASLLSEESVALLKELDGRLAAEIAFEYEFSADYEKAMEELALAQYEDDFAPLLPRFNRLAEEYFRKRESVLALHALCNSYRDGLVRRALQRVEDLLELEGYGKPPGPYCCLASGSTGRLEQTFCVDPSYTLIYGDSSPGGATYFEKFAFHTLAILQKIGLLKHEGQAAAIKNLWCGSRTAWRREIVEELAPLGELVRRADLRRICGDEALSDEMINIVWSMLEFHHGELRETTRSEAMASRTRAAVSFPLPALRDMGKEIAEMPTGLDFFSRLRLEKSGPYRGKFDLEQFALSPLITNVRMLTISRALHETSTIGRIKRLQEGGYLSVELTERLLRAYHDFIRLKVDRQLTGGCEDEQACFIDPQALTEDEGLRLRNGLEAVAGLEKIAYLSFTEQG
jgi:CBS domain-containing protein